MNELILSELKNQYTLTERDMGKYHILKKNGMKFIITAYRIEKLGFVSFIEMRAMLGLMKMESFILTAAEKDLPLFSGDFINAMGRCTLIIEFYDTMIAPLPPDAVENFRSVKAKFGGLPPYEPGPRWYDSIRYDFSFGAVDKSMKARQDEITGEYLKAYTGCVTTAPDVDPVVKKAATRKYVDGLFANGGPAVDQFKKLFGEPAAREIFGQYLFSVD